MTTIRIKGQVTSKPTKSAQAWAGTCSGTAPIISATLRAVKHAMR